MVSSIAGSPSAQAVPVIAVSPPTVAVANRVSGAAGGETIVRRCKIFTPAECLYISKPWFAYFRKGSKQREENVWKAIESQCWNMYGINRGVETLLCTLNRRSRNFQIYLAARESFVETYGGAVQYSSLATCLWNSTAKGTAKRTGM